MKAADLDIAKAIIILGIEMDALVPEGDGTRVATTGETFEATEMDGDLAIVDVARSVNT
jgi:hypothetical protein